MTANDSNIFMIYAVIIKPMSFISRDKISDVYVLQQMQICCHLQVFKMLKLEKTDIERSSFGWYANEPYVKNNAS